ncbi:MAG TPA: ABC transporter substrate-binding protein [Candidatus Binatia bacterium]|nr:ABC transporter substrate-binding protein [Candidatus Binatia bacterium]
MAKSRMAILYFLVVAGSLQFTFGGGALAEPIRVAMPSKSLTFLNFYLAEKFGLFKNEGLEASFPVGKADVQLTAVVTGEMEYIAAAGTVLRGAATGLPVKAVMFALDKPIFFMMVKPETKRIQDIRGKPVAVTALAATDALGARAMAKAAGMNPDQDLVFLSAGNTANALAALQAGSAAAAMLSIPFNLKAEELGYRSLGNAADFLRTVLSGLGTSDARIKSNPAQVKRAIRAALRGMDLARDPTQQDKILPFIVEDFQLDRKTAETSLREIVRHYSKDGTTGDDAIRTDIEFVREQNKIKAAIPTAQVLDYSLLKEVLAEMKK